MKPEPRKSPNANSSASNRFLTTRMKTNVKLKSPEALPQTFKRRTAILKQITSTTKKSSPRVSVQYSVSDTNISNISSIKSCESLDSLCLLRPDIIITDDTSAKPNVKDNPSSKKISRIKVRSPANGKVQKARSKGVISSDCTKSKLDEAEKQLRRKSSEILSLNRKINNLQKTITEKEKTIRDLEIKFPKMLADIKKGFVQDESKKKVNRELKDTLKRNRQLSGSQKQAEDQLKVKEEKLEKALRAKDKAIDDFKLKEKEAREAHSRVASLEAKLPDLVMKLEEKGRELRRCKDVNVELETCLKALREDNFLKVKAIDQISNRVFDLNNNLLVKDTEIFDLRQHLFELQNEKQVVVENYSVMEKQYTNLLKVMENDSLNNNGSFVNDGGDLLERLMYEKSNGTVSRKLTSKNSKRSDCGGPKASFINRRYSLKTLTAAEEGALDSSGDEYPSVFGSVEDDVMSIASENSCFSNVDSNASQIVYDVSDGTIARAEELDKKVHQMWNRVSVKDDTFAEISENRRAYNESVSALESDLNSSIMQHNKFLDRVLVAKKLFD